MDPSWACHSCFWVGPKKKKGHIPQSFRNHILENVWHIQIGGTPAGGGSIFDLQTLRKTPKKPKKTSHRFGYSAKSSSSIVAFKKPPKKCQITKLLLMPPVWGNPGFWGIEKENKLWILSDLLGWWKNPTCLVAKMIRLKRPPFAQVTVSKFPWIFHSKKDGQTTLPTPPIFCRIFGVTWKYFMIHPNLETPQNVGPVRGFCLLVNY